MRVFCSQCGTSNEGQPGTKIMCTACTSVFEVPAAPVSGTASTVMSGTPPELPPGAQPPGSAQPPAVNAPPNWGTPSNPGTPGPMYPAPAGQKPKTNGLAIASLVLGVLCCLPLASTAAIVCGVIALNQIGSSPTPQEGKGLAIAGISLGGVSLAITIITVIISLAANH